MIISVIIPAFNEESTVGACIESVLEQNHSKKHEIIFVDNNSTDKTPDIARSYDITVITEKNKGVAHARLAGLKASSGEIVSYMDADCVADKKWLRVISESFGDEDVVAVSGRVLYDKPNPDPLYFDSLYWNVWHPFRFKINKPIFWGANMAIRKSSLKEKYFQTKLKAYEDLILGQKLARNKKPHEKIIYNKDMIVTTFDTPSHMP